MFHIDESIFHINEKLQIKISGDIDSPNFFFLNTLNNFTGSHFIL